MSTTPPPEAFVDATRAGEFLSLKPRRVLELARAGHLPAYPIGAGKRRVWRFRLSELATALHPFSPPIPTLVYARGEKSYASKPRKQAVGSK